MLNTKKFLNKIIKIIEPPYLQELENYGIVDEKEIKYVFSKKFKGKNIIWVDKPVFTVELLNPLKVYYHNYPVGDIQHKIIILLNYKTDFCEYLNDPNLSYIYVYIKDGKRFYKVYKNT